MIYAAHFPCNQRRMSTTMASDVLPAISGYCCCWRRAVIAKMLVLTLQLCCWWHTATAQSADDWVSLNKRRLTIEEGRTGEATCSTRPGANGTATWIDRLDRVVSADNRSRVYYDPASGRLMLSDAKVTDSGVYVCALNLTAGCRDEGVAPRCNATLHCSVYVMPDYIRRRRRRRVGHQWRPDLRLRRLLRALRHRGETTTKVARNAETLRCALTFLCLYVTRRCQRQHCVLGCPVVLSILVNTIYHERLEQF